MGPTKQQSRLLAEVSHQINSPLAAIRNALYLAAQHCDDHHVLDYLAIANEEVSSIVNRIRDLRVSVEIGGPQEHPVAAPPPVQIMRKAA